MQLKDIMTRNVESVIAQDSLMTAAQKMDRVDTGFLPVMQDGKVIGLLTDRDIVVRGLAKGCDPKATQCNEIMTATIERLPESAEARQAADLMEQRQIRRLMVVDNKDQLVGILSLGDLAVHVHDRPLSGEVLERVSQPL